MNIIVFRANDFWILDQNRLPDADTFWFKKKKPKNNSIEHVDRLFTT